MLQSEDVVKWVLIQLTVQCTEEINPHPDTRGCVVVFAFAEKPLIFATHTAVSQRCVESNNY